MPEELYGRSPPLSLRSLNAALISLAMGQDGRRSEIILGQAYISGGDATLIKSVAHRVWRTKETQRGRIEGEEKKGVHCVSTNACPDEEKAIRLFSILWRNGGARKLLWLWLIATCQRNRAVGYLWMESILSFLFLKHKIKFYQF